MGECTFFFCFFLFVCFCCLFLVVGFDGFLVAGVESCKDIMK